MGETIKRRSWHIGIYLHKCEVEIRQGDFEDACFDVSAGDFVYFDSPYVPVSETIRGFKEILDGLHDDLPEEAFRLVGTIDDAIKKAKEITK